MLHYIFWTKKPNGKKYCKNICQCLMVLIISLDTYGIMQLHEMVLSLWERAQDEALFASFCQISQRKEFLPSVEYRDRR